MIIMFIVTLIAVFGIPLAAVLFATDAGMAICILSFYVINPMVSVAAGVYAGLRKQWYICLFPAMIFIITALLLFTLSEPIFLYYSAVYLAFSFISMIATSLIIKRKK